MGKYEFGEDIIDNHLCANSEEKLLFVTNHVEIPATWTFKDFSNVHKEAQVYDVQETRERLIGTKLYKSICK